MLDDTQKANLSSCKYAVFFSDYTEDAPFDVSFTAHVLIPLGAIGIFADTNGNLKTSGSYNSRSILVWSGSTEEEFTTGSVEYCKFETESGKLMCYSKKSHFFTRSGTQINNYSGFLNNYAVFGGYPVLNPQDNLKLIVRATGKTQSGTGSSYDLHIALRIVPIY